MTEQQATAVVRFWKSGGRIRDTSEPYVQAMGAVIEECGQFLYRDNVLTPTPLIEMSFHKLRFYREVEHDELMKLNSK